MPHQQGQQRRYTYSVVRTRYVYSSLIVCETVKQRVGRKTENIRLVERDNSPTLSYRHSPTYPWSMLHGSHALFPNVVVVPHYAATLLALESISLFAILLDITWVLCLDHMGIVCYMRASITIDNSRICSGNRAMLRRISSVPSSRYIILRRRWTRSRLCRFSSLFHLHVVVFTMRMLEETPHQWHTRGLEPGTKQASLFAVGITFIVISSSVVLLRIHVRIHLQKLQLAAEDCKTTIIAGK
jgi:hypothetical protein